MMKREEGEKNPVILNEILNDVIAILHGEAVFRHVDIATELAGSLPPVLADRIQLQQVILNLIMNAVEAAAQSSPDVEKLLCGPQARDGCLQLSVRDFGRGSIRET